MVDKGKGRDIEEVEDRIGLAKLEALARAEENRQAMSPTPTMASTRTIVAQPQPQKPAVKNFSRPHRRSSSDVVTSLSPQEEEENRARSVSRGPETSVSGVRDVSASAPPARKQVPVTSVVSHDSEDDDDDDIMPALRYMMPKTYMDDHVAPPTAASEIPKDSHSEDPDERRNSGERIVPTPIRQRPPPSSFSVMSRPQHKAQQDSTSTITPSSLLAPVPISPTSVSSNTTISAASTAPSSTTSSGSKSSSPRLGKKRSSSMLNLPTDAIPTAVPRSTHVPTKSTPSSPPAKSQTTPALKSSPSTLSHRPRSRSSAPLISQIPDQAPLSTPDTRPQVAPPTSRSTPAPARSSLVSKIPATNAGLTANTKPKPFAGAMRRESPASSTGDSSSGRVPLTPRDGSEIGDWGSDMSRLSGGLRPVRDKKDYIKRRSVSFDNDGEFDRGRDRGIVRERDRVEKVESPMDGESRRRERRRSEARAAIEVCLFFPLSMHNH